MKRTAIAFAVSAALLTMSAVLAQQAKPGSVSGDVVKIGVLTDMSGLYSDLGGAGSVEAARMAVADFGAKVLGKSIEIIGADHQNKADVGAQKAREWFDQQGVDMITDALNSAVAIAVTKVAGEKKRVLMDVGAASTRLTNEDCNPYTVHYAYDTYALANGTGNAIVKQGGKYGSS